MSNLKYQKGDAVIVKFASTEYNPDELIAEGVICEVDNQSLDDMPYRVRIPEMGSYWCGETNPRWTVMGYANGVMNEVQSK